MAIRVLRRLGLGFEWSLGRRANVVALIAVSAFAISPAEAQVTVGNRSGSSVTVDNGVLEGLGPPPAGKVTPPRAAKKAPAKTAIHLVPPKSRVARAAPTQSGKADHREATSNASTKPSVAALAPPVAAPALQRPASSDTPAVAKPQQSTRGGVPGPAPSEPAPATPSPVTPAPPAAATVASAAAMPSMRVSPTPPAASAPPVQAAAATTVGGAETAIKFKPGVTELGVGAQPALDALAARMLANPEFRVELVSHAVGAPDAAMEARRVSLARAVAIRAYLVEKGVQGVRIVVRALGNNADKGPISDQVDLQVVSQ